MTDKELLEYAAKSAGYGVDLLSEEPSGWYIYSGDERQKEFDTKYVWNPLTDDGDALRLAVKLGLTIDVCPAAEPAEVRCTPYSSTWDELDRCDEPLTNDHYSSTRRAIVRAAAEIGKSHD